jgi:hypothetical protein
MYWYRLQKKWFSKSPPQADSEVVRIRQYIHAPAALPRGRTGVALLIHVADVS